MSRAYPPANDNIVSAQKYRQQALEFASQAQTTRSLKDGARYRKMAAACIALAREHDWLAGNSNTLGSPSAP
jgi:hypothetical protein